MSERRLMATDYFLVVVALIFFGFFLLKLVPELFLWVDDTNGWFFFAFFLILIIKPVYKMLKKK